MELIREECNRIRLEENARIDVRERQKAVLAANKLVEEQPDIGSL